LGFDFPERPEDSTNAVMMHGMAIDEDISNDEKLFGTVWYYLYPSRCICQTHWFRTVNDMVASPILGKYHALERLGAGAYGNLTSWHTTSLSWQVELPF
jgi:hypothetical protein